MHDRDVDDLVTAMKRIDQELKDLDALIAAKPEWKVTISRGQTWEPGRWKWSVWSPTRGYAYEGFTATQRGAKKAALESYSVVVGLTNPKNTYKVVVVGNEPHLVSEKP